MTGATKPPAHAEGGEGVSSLNVGKPSHPDAAVSQFLELHFTGKPQSLIRRIRDRNFIF